MYEHPHTATHTLTHTLREKEVELSRAEGLDLSALAFFSMP